MTVMDNREFFFPGPTTVGRPREVKYNDPLETIYGAPVMNFALVAQLGGLLGVFFFAYWGPSGGPSGFLGVIHGLHAFQAGLFKTQLSPYE